ncbi:cystine transport system permease protein [Butyrivibrio sp. INlla18]|jgi:cystine transport system permease protein|uniref:amino acid ABC transporter permease n=1 Tax=unclassified Butyrivibrio TaxID=2639466 RepID=UPI00087E0F07|nr:MULTISPECIES: amino acid ABC transporter permease [unclassified Butyrivibrio]MBE5840405.1 amino acid ABC transporter permease [Butyrivibrio sp.]SDA66459.1 cystine transport system permease protein [Butyrivibrio sp. INlla18]
MLNEKTLELLMSSFPKILEYGLKVTLPLAALAFILSTVIAVLVAMVQYADVPVIKEICRLYIWIIRGTPLLVQLMVAFYGLPLLGIHSNPFVMAVIVFSINEGAYSAETMRAAMEAVPAGQLEAGYCVGMNYMQIMWHIILPQAFRTAFPSLFNALISMVKDTSLASSITVVEMFTRTKQLAGQSYNYLPLYIEVALVYLIFCTVLTFIQKKGEKILGSYGQRK